MESGRVETHESDMEIVEWMTWEKTVTCLSPLHRPAHTSCHRSRPEHEGLGRVTPVMRWRFVPILVSESQGQLPLTGSR